MNNNYCIDFFQKTELKKLLFEKYKHDLVDMSYENFQELFFEIITNISSWTESKVRERSKIFDEKGPGTVSDFKTIPNEYLNAFYQEAADIGFLGLSASKNYGGMNFPSLLSFMGFSLVAKECLSSSAQIGFFLSMISMIEKFCDEQDKQELIPLIIQGKISGCMCLTESEAGSDLASIQTIAIKNSEGYFLNGSKIFITNGGGGFAFVLAKTTEGYDLKNLSLFLVKQENNNYRVVKNEDKMGLKGSFTCELLFQNSKAKLIGAEGEGFSMMLHLMNEARLAVGLQALGGLHSIHEKSLKYATERKQFQTPIKDFALVKNILDEMELLKNVLSSYILQTLLEYNLLEKGEVSLKYKVRKKTPLVKFFATETFTRLSQKAIQVFGGYGFMKDYEVERIHRDSFALLVYEGTSQIQSLMSLRDYIKRLRSIKDFCNLYHLKLKYFFQDSLSRSFLYQNISVHCKILWQLVFHSKSIEGKAEYIAETIVYLDIMEHLISTKNSDSKKFLKYMKEHLSSLKLKICS